MPACEVVTLSRKWQRRRLVWLTHLSPARPFFASCIGIAGPFFASVAVLFSVFAAFLANDVHHVQAEAKAAVFR
jgi:hypothetical protein